MKFYYWLILMFCLPALLHAQDPPCPKKNQKNYICGEVKEDILASLVNSNYKFGTKIKVNLSSKFKRSSDKIKADSILLLCERVLNDKDFWKALENYKTYKTTVWRDSTSEMVISGKQIVNSLLNGNPNNNARPEELTITLKVKLYGFGFKFPFFEKALAKEIGDSVIYNKKWFFRKYTQEQIGSNWVHEFSHIQGLKHCFHCDENRDYSIPYVINRIFIEVAKKYIN